MYSFCEITPDDEIYGSDFSKTFDNYRPLAGKNFKLLKIKSSSDIWLSFKKIFGAKND